MMEFQNTLKIDKKTIESPNLTDHFNDDELKALGNHVWEGYNRDKQSRQKWEKRTQAAMDLAMQIQKDKSFPWQGASNIAFPLVTIAALQFHSRAYPTILNGSEIVRYRVNGDDPQGIDVWDAGQEVNPSPLHECQFAFSAVKSVAEIAEKQPASHQIEDLDYLRYLRRKRN